MKNILLTLILLLSLTSCKSSKQTKSKKADSSRVINKKHHKTKAEYIIDYAKKFEGVRYKFGGTTKAGMDCSGLIYESFRANNITLPRISRDMAKKGNEIQLKNALKGDLLYFKTGNRRNSINHVGLIVDIHDNDIKFIHSTTSRGVIISRLNESYWLKAFHEARRIL